MPGRQKKYAFLLVAIVLAAAVAWYFSGTGSVPVLSLNPSNFEQFRNAFNVDSNTTRVVLLLSPT